MSVDTYWNGEPCEARRISCVMADSPEFPRFWGRHLVGDRVDAVEVRYNGEKFFIYDEHGEGWAKVTTGKGSPSVAHKNMRPEPKTLIWRREPT
jgi:hypothetical protein